MIVLGVMSGSSLDGLDMALINMKTEGYELLHSATIPLSADITKRLREYNSLTSLEYIKLDRDYSLSVAQIIKNFLSTIDHEISLIGVHGHTIIHMPSEGITVQLGNGGIISSMTNIDTITDFRIQDITRGGEGTPLVSIADINLFVGYDYYLNLGGIANITSTLSDDMTAYDICPCNQVLNHFAKKYFGLPYDNNGVIARSGSFVSHCTEEIDKLPYWNKEAPKSLDNNWIQEEVILKIDKGQAANNLLFTMTKWIAEKISNAISVKNTRVFISGGGAYNTFLIECLETLITTKNIELIVADPKIVDYKEAILMAYLAFLRITNQHNVLSQVTKAKGDSIGGAHYKA